MKKKVLVTSILTMILCVCLIVGSTFALFTSKSEVNVAVTSGKVDVVATIVKDSVEKGSTLGEMLDETSIEVSDADNTITLDKIVPGDFVKFELAITNNSNVSIKYRVVLSVLEDDGLFEGLVVEIGNEEYDGTVKYSQWEPLAPEGKIENVSVSISLPEFASNDLQAKSCKFAYAVEAVQGNAKIYDGVAKIGEETYDSIQEALDAAESGNIVEILNPGVYAPVTMNKENVTLKGIVGKTMKDSTVFYTTPANEIRLYANGVTVDSIWVEVTEGAANGAWQNNSGVFDAYISVNSGKVADHVTISNCKIFGNNIVDYVILYCYKNITFENNYVEGFKAAVSAMCDNGTAESYVISGNTLKNVDALIDGYWGTPYEGEGANITICDNEALDNTLIRLWDYVQTKGVEASAINAVVKGNKNAVLMMTETDRLADTGLDTDVAESEIIYQHYVMIKGLEEGEYTVQKADGSLNDNFNDTTKLKVGATGEGKFRLTVGSYKLVCGDVVYEVTVGKTDYEITVTP